MPSPRSAIGIVSFPHIFTAKAPAPDADPRYSLVLIFDDTAQKTDDYRNMKKDVMAAATEKWGNKTVDMIKTGKLRMPFRDASEKDYAGYDEGSVFVSFWSKNPPGIVGPRLEDLAPSDVFPGMKGRVTYSAFAYDVSGNKGVSFGLNNFQGIDFDMPRLDGRAKANEDFDALDDPEDEPGADDDLDIPFMITP